MKRLSLYAILLVVTPMFGAHTLISGFELCSLNEGFNPSLDTGSVQSNVVRSGKCAYEARAVSSNPTIVFASRAPGGGLRSIFRSARFYINVAQLPLTGSVSIVKIGGAATLNPEVDLNWDGTLTLADSLYPVISKSTNALTADGQWHRIEFDAGYGIRVYVDGVLWASGGTSSYSPGIAMSLGAGESPTSINATCDLFFDDVLADDDSFSNDGLPGDGRALFIGATGPSGVGSFTTKGYASVGIGAGSTVLDTMPACLEEQTGNGANTAVGSIASLSNPTGSAYQFDFGGSQRNSLMYDTGPVQVNPSVNLASPSSVSISVVSGSSKGVNILSVGLYVNFR